MSSEEEDKLEKEIIRLNESVRWYQRTYEHRSILGLLKDYLYRRISFSKPTFTNKGSDQAILSLAGLDGTNSVLGNMLNSQKGCDIPGNGVSLAGRKDPALGMNGSLNQSSNQKRRSKNPVVGNTTLKNLLTYFHSRTSGVGVLNKNCEVDILLPVYDGLGFLKTLLPQILENSDLPFRLFIINDGSPDPEVIPYLNAFSKMHPNIVRIDNETNIGFTHSVNKALKQTTNHVVLLNSDTEVPPGWLSRLLSPIIMNPEIASCTPFSNCATICSFPNIGDNSLFNNMSVVELDAVFQKGKPNYFEIPTGVGFCMALNRLAIERIGILDEEQFEKGYGEEVDWCQRALAAGFKNVLVQNIFVYHKHGGSFSAETKSRLVAEHTAILDKRYPSFHPSVMDCIANSIHNPIRDLYLLFAAHATADKTVLYLDHALGGGANYYMENEVTDRRLTNLVLVLKYDFPHSNPSNQYTLRLYFKDYSCSYTLSSVRDLSDLLNFVSLDELVVSELVSYPAPLKLLILIRELKTKHQFRSKFLVHDYYSVCPNFILMYKNKSFCNVPEISGCEECVKMVNYDPILFPSDYSNLSAWREQWFQFLCSVDSIVCFSNSSKSILLKAYPDLEDARIQIIPHELKKTKISSSFNVGILGNILTQFKGSLIVHQIAEKLHEQQNDSISLHLFGAYDPQYKHARINNHGTYNRDDLSALFDRFQIDLIFIPSVCSETFSYTTLEAIQTGIPVCSFRLGGQGEQVSAYKNGFILEEMKEEYVIEQFFKIAELIKTKKNRELKGINY